MHSVDELNALDSSVESIIVDSNACKDESFTILNMTRFVNLRVFEVGDYSFRQVEVVHLIGLSKLERGLLEIAVSRMTIVVVSILRIINWL